MRRLAFRAITAIAGAYVGWRCGPELVALARAHRNAPQPDSEPKEAAQPLGLDAQYDEKTGAWNLCWWGSDLDCDRAMVTFITSPNNAKA